MSENIIIQESGVAKAMTVDAIQIKNITGGRENWVSEAEDVNSLIKMSIGKNAEIDAEDYNAQAITEVNVTQEIMGIETEPDEAKKNIESLVVSIKEGNKAFFMGDVKKLRVNLQNGGTTEYMRRSSVETGTLYATRLGEYKAADYGYIGYSRVCINVPESEWGNLPDEIKIIVPPHKTTYDDGENIDVTGMVVQARKNGEVWENDEYVGGIIPLNEIELSNNVAELYERNGYERNGYTHVKFRRDKVPDGVDASYMPDVFIIKRGHFGMWTSYYEWGPAGNRKHNIDYEVIWAGVAESVDDIISTIFSEENGCGVMALIGLNDSPFSCYTYGTGSIIRVGSTEEIDLIQAKQMAYKEYDSMAGNEEEERSSIYHVYTLRKIEGKKVNYSFIQGGVGPFANNPNDDAAVNTIITSAQPYEIARLEYAIMYSILFGDRALELKWKRPHDNATLSTMLYINISNGV